MSQKYSKRYLIFFLGAFCGVLLSIVVGCLDFKRPDIVVREPSAPGESTIQYTPPPDLNVSIEAILEVAPFMGDMMPKVKKVTDDVYVAMNYDLANVAMVITDEGLIIVDTTGSEENARKAWKALRKITDKPVRYIIYTHFHPDHTQGTSVFMEEGTEVIATEAFLEWINYQNEFLGKHHRRSRAIQGGLYEPEWAFNMPTDTSDLVHWADMKVDVVMPTITFKDEYAFTLGGKRFELFATSGETNDHLATYMPEKKILFIGDLYYQSFPNLSSPMLESRPVRGWIDSLTRFIEIEPDFLVLGHTNTLKGAGLIKEYLSNYREAIKYVHDETVRCINEGKTVDEAVAEIELPERLKKLLYLQEYYGRVSWSVRGIYHGYKGWYDGQGPGLNPLPPSYRAREIVRLAGGVDKILARAIELQQNDEHQLSAELCDVVLAANPDDKLAHRILAESMKRLAYTCTNLNCFGCYRSAYSMHMKAAGEPPLAFENIDEKRSSD